MASAQAAVYGIGWVSDIVGRPTIAIVNLL